LTANVISDTLNTVLDGFTIQGGNANGSITSQQQGGGIYCNNSALWLENLTIKSNKASQQGGGIYNTSSDPVLLGSTLDGNSANFGGGMFNTLNSSPSVINTRFIGNHAVNNGGGMRNTSSQPKLLNVTFSGNTAESGGAIHNNASNIVIHNATFWNNTSNTFPGSNSMYNQTSSPVINNSIFWNTTFGGSSDHFYNDTVSELLIYQSVLQFGCPTTRTECSGTIINSDPRFIDADGPDDQPGTPDDNLRLFSNSPAVDQGDNNLLPADPLDLDEDGVTLEELPVDADGRPRSVDVPFVTDAPLAPPPVADIGAYETRIFFVDANAAGANNGLSWVDAFSALQPALSAAIAGDAIWVADGVYTPTLTTEPGDPRSAVFSIQNGITLLGGYLGGESDPVQRKWLENPSVLSGDLNGDDSGFDNNDENSYHVVSMADIDGTTILDGFRIQNGNADDEAGPLAHQNGGGMYTLHSNPALRNLVFYNNYAISGGGLYNDFSSPRMINCQWIANRARFGGGVRNYASNPSVINAIFNSNSAFGGGGGAYNTASQPTFVNATFVNNQADEEERIEHDGDGILSDGGSVLVVANSILWDNQDQPVSNVPGSTAEIMFAMVEGGCPDPSTTTCTVLIQGDPHFADANGPDLMPGTLDDDLHLLTSSPGLDKGENNQIPADESDIDNDGDRGEQLPIDLEGNGRFRGPDEFPKVDLGPYESPGIQIFLPLVFHP
jgi:hypothetical protein